MQLIIFSRYSDRNSSYVALCFFSLCRKGLDDRYISRMNARKRESPDNDAYRQVIYAKNNISYLLKKKANLVSMD